MVEMIGKLSAERFRIFLEKGTLYLLRNAICDEDGIAHNGRRAYAWTLMRWLYERDGDSIWMNRMEELCAQLGPNIRKNSYGAMVIYPGLHERRNYSTNAIDCGIIVDSFHDFKSILPLKAGEYSHQIDEIAHSYLVEKINSDNRIHNQYLWACTGLSRWVSSNYDHPMTEKYIRSLMRILSKWEKYIEEDGYTPYKSDVDNPFQDAATTYYHSRCIAFCLYILENCGIKNERIENGLERSAYFLANMIRVNGTKEIALESKRYYFFGDYEVGSHSYDLYVYSWMYRRTGELNWLILAYHVLSFLIEAQEDDGAVASHNLPSVYDWQCDTMRNSHLAWLTRVPDDFYTAIFSLREPIHVPKPMSSRSQRHICVVGDKRAWAHCVIRKSPLAGHVGQRVSGIILETKPNIHSLLSSYPLHYRIRGNPREFVKSARPALDLTFRNTLYKVFDCIVFKRRLRQAWQHLKYDLLEYFFAGLLVRSTEFCCILGNVRLGETSLSHDLVATDVLGEQERNLGHRTIDWSGSKVNITDQLTFWKQLRVRLPAGWKCHGGKIVTSGEYLVGPGEVQYQGSILLGDLRA